MEAVKEITFERTYDAPLDQVWQAWTDPNMLKQWWGPNDVIIPECEVDLRVGGRFYIVMEAGEAMGPYKGTRWPMEAQFTVVEPQNKLAYTARAWTEGHEQDMRIDSVHELLLTEESSQTKLTLKATVNHIGPNAQMAIQGMQHGFNQQLDKLTDYLAQAK